MIITNWLSIRLRNQTRTTTASQASIVFPDGLNEVFRAVQSDLTLGKTAFYQGTEHLCANDRLMRMDTRSAFVESVESQGPNGFGAKLLHSSMHTGQKGYKGSIQNKIQDCASREPRI